MTGHEPHATPPFPIVAAPPLSYRLFSWLSRHRLRGAERLRRVATARGWFAVAAWVRCDDADPSVRLLVPFSTHPYPTDLLRSYESWILDALRPIVATLPGRTLLVDAGADIGLMTLRLTSLIAASQRAGTVAIEPNSASFAFLHQSLGANDPAALTVNAAVGAASGRGALHRPAYDPDSAQAAYIEADPEGPVQIVALDDLPIMPHDSLLLKLDVEGAELDALRGAEQLLRGAAAWCVLLEVHALALARTGRPPSAVVEQLAALGAKHAVIAEDGRVLIRDGVVVERDIPNAICNVVASCLPNA
jgi:FkbM family methyltransferase